MPILNLTLIGDSKVGKTQLLNRWLHNKFDEHVLLTYGHTFVKHQTPNLTIHGNDAHLNIWDAGSDGHSRITLPTTYQKADIVLLVFDITQLDSLDYIQDFLNAKGRFLGRKSLKKEAQYVLVGTHMDCEQEVPDIPTEAQALLDEHDGMAYVALNAKKDVGMSLGVRAGLSESLNQTIKAIGEILFDKPAMGTPVSVVNNESFHAVYDKLIVALDSNREKMTAILQNYLHGDSVNFQGGFGRFFSGHWNRHHIKEVTHVLGKLNVLGRAYTELDAFNELATLDKIKGGSLSLRLQYMKTALFNDDVSLNPSKENDGLLLFPSP